MEHTCFACEQAACMLRDMGRHPCHWQGLGLGGACSCLINGADKVVLQQLWRHHQTYAKGVQRIAHCQFVTGSRLQRLATTYIWPALHWGGGYAISG